MVVVKAVVLLVVAAVTPWGKPALGKLTRKPKNIVIRLFLTNVNN
jgi:hypothetical protein